ncbi:hypothetical protein BTVI_68634 [Pitangus sulphuratus]|nr:hypothetical protein BTVI_68634 [Pitangus sulphuratus]
MRGRLLARLRRRRLLRLLLALGALALGLWAAYLELVATAGGGAAPERKAFPMPKHKGFDIPDVERVPYALRCLDGLE